MLDRPLYVNTLLTIGALAIWATVLGLLHRKYRRSGARRLDALAAAMARATGVLLLAIPGLLHTFVIAVSAFTHDRVFDARLAWLLTIGLVISYAGATCAGAARGLRTGSRDAVSRALWNGFYLLAFLFILHPILEQTVLIAITFVHLGLLVGLRFHHRRWRENSNDIIGGCDAI
jgi:hypothetical protein